MAILISWAFISCETSSLEKSLQFAGGNRKELEKVLEYYKHDSIKYKAATFLIQNMPPHYSLISETLDHYRSEIYLTCIENNCTAEVGYKILQAKYGPLKLKDYKRVYDSHVITADYLIENIEFSVKVWKESHWNCSINFDDFCEYILPYRLSYEPLENWKETYYQVFSPLLDSALVNKNDPLAACEVLYSNIISRKWVFTEQKLFPYMGALNFLDNYFGNCDDRAEFAAYVMKALGLPGGIDCILQQPNRYPRGHSWNFVLDSLKNTVEFMLYDQPPVQNFRSKNKGKVYRKTFSSQTNNLLEKTRYTKNGIPESLRDLFVLDVSDNYFPNVHFIEIDFYRPSNILYLCVFNNKEWIPIAWLKNKKNAILKNVESGIMYMMGYYKDEQILPASYPFRLIDDCSYEFINPSPNIKQDMSLTRKYPIKAWWKWLDWRSLNGKFQVSDYADFRDSITVNQVKHGLLDMRWHSIQLDSSLYKRYIRYLSAEDGYCNLAEMEVFVNGEMIQNVRIIGTEGSCRNDPHYEKEAVFDRDPLTFYDAKEASQAWVGLDLGIKSHISEIRYLFRNDDNSIRIGDLYELYYWDSQKWTSLGMQTAKENELYYDECPVNALFLLHNHSRGMEERIFLYKDETQEWW